MGVPAVLCSMLSLFHSSITGKWQQKKECLEIKFLSSMAGQQINLCAARIDENHDDFILENYDFV